MSQNIEQIENQISKLEDKAKQKRALLQAKKAAIKNKERAEGRKARNRHIYKLGGMVEKMGLDQLPENEFLGLLDTMHRHYKYIDTDKKNQLRENGRAFSEAGKKLERV